MADIKTRDAVKGTIKTIDKAAIASERMKSAYVEIKERAEQGYYADENSATEYAADRISYAADRVKDEGIHQFNKQGQKAVKTTQENVELNENQSFGGAVSMKSSSGSVIAMVILLVFFIIGSGYLLIYNVLYISISNDTRFYGLMKTLGTTQKQIKSLVKNQAVKFACIGIPIGILLATAVSFGIVTMV